MSKRSHHDATLAEIVSFTVRRSWVFMPRADLVLDDGTKVRYRMRDARQIERELASLLH